VREWEGREGGGATPSHFDLEPPQFVSRSLGRRPLATPVGRQPTLSSARYTDVTPAAILPRDLVRSGQVIIIIIIAMTMFMVLSSWPKVIARVHPVHLNVD